MRTGPSPGGSCKIQRLLYTFVMTLIELQKTALRLPVRERQELVEALWESLEGEPVKLPMWQIEAIDARLADLERTPEEGSSWEEVEKSKQHKCWKAWPISTIVNGNPCRSSFAR